MCVCVVRVIAPWVSFAVAELVGWWMYDVVLGDAAARIQITFVYSDGPVGKRQGKMYQYCLIMCCHAEGGIVVYCIVSLCLSLPCLEL